MKGSAAYYARVLRALSAGEWVAAQELTHPVFPRRGFEATVRLLQSVGFAIDQDGSDGTARFRLLGSPLLPYGSTVRLRGESEGRRSGEEAMLLVYDTNDETALVMFVDGTAATLSVGELDLGDSDEPPAATPEPA